MGEIKYKGIKGLTAEDRAQWEKDNIDELMSKGYNDLPDNDKHDVFKSWAFKAKFGDRDDYNNLKALPPEQKDSLFNTGFDFQQPDTRDDTTRLADNLEESLNKGVEYSQRSEKLLSDYMKLPGAARRELDNFDKIATQVSPYYKKFKDTEYLPFSEDDKLKLAAEYNAAREAYGEDEANTILRRKMQNTASENQSVWEKYWNGFRGMGAQATGAIIGTAGMIKGAIDYVADDTESELNPFMDFMNHIIDNEWTRYGNDVMQYGSLFDADIKKAKETGVSNIPIIRTTAEEQGGILDNLLSVNTIPELINQQGFTIASMLTGAGLSSIADKAFKGAKAATLAMNRAGTISNLEKVNSVLKGLQQAQQGFNAFAIPAMVGTVEGVSEGLNTKIQFLDDAKRQIADTQSKAINAEIQRRLQDPEELSRQGYNMQDPADMQRLYKEVFDSYAPRYQEAVKRAETNAAKAGIYNMGLNSMINGVMNVTLKAGLQTPSVQEALRRSRLGRVLNPREFKVDASGKVTPKAGKISSILNVLKEPAGEFTEEYTQGIFDAFARGGATYNLQQFIDNKYKGDGKTAVDDSMANDLLAASKAAGEAATDKETILAGIYGALSSGLGTPTINNRRGPSIKMEDESKLSYALRRSPITYRNPIWEAIQEQRELGKERAEVASVVTDWLQDPANRSKYDGLVGTFNWAQELDKAAGDNDEFAYRNTTLGKTINDVMMLQRIQGTDYYNSFMNDLTRAANAEEGSEEAQALVQQFRNAPNNRDVDRDDATILQTIKDNATKVLDTMSSIQQESDKIDKMLGNAADEDTKQALIYGKLAMNDWKDRATKLEEEINAIQVDGHASTLTDNQKSLLAKYGSFKNAIENVQSLKEKESSLTKDIAAIERRKNLSTNESAILKTKKAALKSIQKEIKQARKEEEAIEGDYILSESDILRLNPADRAAMLNPENKSKYSEEQRDIIDNLIEKGTLKYTDFMNKVQDAGRINIAQEAYLKQYNSILSDPASLNAYANRIKQQVARDNARKKYERLNDITDYKTFTSELDKAYRTASVAERSIIRETLKDNENYNRYIESNKKLEGMLDQLDSNERFSGLSDNDKANVVVAMQYLEDQGVDPTGPQTIESLAETDENGNSKLLNYIDEVNGRLPEDMQITPSSLGEIIQTYGDVVQEHVKNTNEVEKVNKPVEVLPTTTEDSKPPVEATPMPSLFSSLPKTEEEARAEARSTAEVSEEEPVVSARDLIADKFSSNSNPEVGEMAGFAIDAVNSASEAYNDVKAQAIDIIDELGDSEYENPDIFRDTLIATANRLQLQSTEGGDRFDRVSSLLKVVAAKSPKASVATKVEAETPKERAKTTDTTVETRRNNGLISTAQVDRHPNSTVGRAYRSFGISNYLRKGKFNRKTPVMFMVDPTISDAVRQEMGGIYNEEDHLPIIAVVEDSEGPVTVGNKRYQPIGFMPRTSANTQGAARMELLRKAALSQQNGTILRSGNTEITTNGYVRAVPPEHTKAGTPNTSIVSIMMNDMSDEDKARMIDPNASIEEKQSIYRRYRDTVLPKIRRITQGSSGERIHLSYVTPNLKGGETEFELYVSTPQNSYSRSGQPIIEVLTEGSSDAVLSANSRLHRYGRTLNSIFKSNPVPDVKFKREGGQLVPIGEGASKITSLGETLTKKLGNFISIPKGYRYIVTPTEDVSSGSRAYTLSVTNDTNTIPLGTVVNGEVDAASIIRNLMLDNGNFRMEGSQPFAKWQVNYNDFNITETDSKDVKKAKGNNVIDIFDDNILESSRQSFNYNITTVDINAPFKSDGTLARAATVANPTNATTVPINTPVIVATDQVKVGDAVVDSETGAILEGSIDDRVGVIDKAKAIVDRITEDSKNVRLTDDNSGYVDSAGVRYARVTSIIQADEHGERFDSNSPWVLPSTNIGTSVDEFVRDFFAGKIYEEGIKNYPNASPEQWKAFANQLQALKNYIDSKGLTVIPRDVTVTGTIQVTDKDGVTHEIPVAGTLDLLAYDEQGNFHIFDMKTHRSQLGNEKINKYAKQVSLYKKFLEDKYGIKVSSLNIIPIQVSYPTPKGAGKGTTEYNVIEGNQISANGQEYRDANPILGNVGSVPVTDVNIQINKLTDSERAMIKDLVPKAKSIEVTEPESTVNPNIGLKMGKVKNRFARPAKKSATVAPSPYNWHSISDEVRQTAITMGYTKESWNSMSDEEKRHQTECLS